MYMKSLFIWNILSFEIIAVGSGFERFYCYVSRLKPN